MGGGRWGSGDVREVRGTLALVLAALLYLSLFRVPRGAWGDFCFWALEVLFAAVAAYGATSLHDFER